MPVRSMPRMRVRTDELTLTFTGGAFRLILLPVATGDS